jgi:thiamine biosynthesis lipoprotein
MEKPIVFSDSFFAMGTRCDVVFTEIETELAEQIFQIVKNEVIHLEHRLSRFIVDSPISVLNETGKDIWIRVEDDIWDILSICYDFWQMSNGAFDITAAPIIRLWKENENPSDSEIEKARKISGFDKVELDFENQKIRFKVDGLEFDLGAIGKGIALDSIKPVLLKQGVKNAIVSFGESSILALGTHPNGQNWPLGIRNNFMPGEYVHVFSTSNETLTTSGSIVNNDVGEVEFRKHIISPATGFPIETKKSVSVKSESATLGEFLSTTWLILPESDQVLLSDKMKNIEILEVEYSEKKEYKTKLTLI